MLRDRVTAKVHFHGSERRLRVDSASSLPSNAVVGRATLRAGRCHSLRGWRTSSFKVDRTDAVKALADRSRQPPTFVRQIRTAADSLKPPFVISCQGYFLDPLERSSPARRSTKRSGVVGPSRALCTWALPMRSRTSGQDRLRDLEGDCRGLQLRSRCQEISGEEAVDRHADPTRRVRPHRGRSQATCNIKLDTFINDTTVRATQCPAVAQVVLLADVDSEGIGSAQHPTSVL